MLFYDHTKTAVVKEIKIKNNAYDWETKTKLHKIIKLVEDGLLEKDQIEYFQAQQEDRKYAFDFLKSDKEINKEELKCFVRAVSLHKIEAPSPYFANQSLYDIGLILFSGGLRHFLPNSYFFFCDISSDIYLGYESRILPGGELDLVRHNPTMPLFMQLIFTAIQKHDKLSLAIDSIALLSSFTLSSFSELGIYEEVYDYAREECGIDEVKIELVGGEANYLRAEFVD